jgi:hypothetical protein
MVSSKMGDLKKEMDFGDDLSKKIQNWQDLIYDLVKDKMDRREFKIEFILAGDENRKYQIDLVDIKGLCGIITPNEETHVTFGIKSIKLIIKGWTILSGEVEISCRGWVYDTLKDPNLKVSVQCNKDEINGNSFSINIAN